MKEPDRSLILKAFAAEPGDTLWRFINAFSRAANLMMVAHGIPREEAIQHRYRLQRQSMNLCEGGLEYFTSGKSIFDSKDTLIKLIEKD